jgi:hypothetical protein
MRWKEVSVTEVTGAGGGPIETRHLSPEERAAQALALIDATFGLVSHGGADADR